MPCLAAVICILSGDGRNNAKRHDASGRAFRAFCIQDCLKTIKVSGCHLSSLQKGGVFQRFLKKASKERRLFEKRQHPKTFIVFYQLVVFKQSLMMTGCFRQRRLFDTRTLAGNLYCLLWINCFQMAADTRG
ncbi:hypothetical protein F1542_02740 [Komagataeibacter sp. FXV3]|nr:hypothetical protein [Komagataeibacter sp. FXV3]